MTRSAAARADREVSSAIVASDKSARLSYTRSVADFDRQRLSSLLSNFDRTSADAARLREDLEREMTARRERDEASTRIVLPPSSSSRRSSARIARDDHVVGRITALQLARNTCSVT